MKDMIEFVKSGEMKTAFNILIQYDEVTILSFICGLLDELEYVRGINSTKALEAMLEANKAIHEDEED